MNALAVPESTPPDTAIRYLDISGVNSLGEKSNPVGYRFEDAPSRARRVVRAGDTVVSTVRTYLKAIAHIEERDLPLVVSTGFAVVSPGSRVYAKFLFYWMRSNLFVDEICARSVGVSYPAANESEISNLPFPEIPLATQRAIADFLDRKTAAIDGLIAKKERLIELLEEKHAALINQVVIKGLDPNVPMKDSGIPWIGEIPAHWDVIKLRRAMQSVEQGWSPQCDDGRRESSEQWAVLKVGCVNFGKFRPEEHKVLPTDLEPHRRYEVHGGDLLMSRANTPELVGSVVVVPDNVEQRLILSDKIYRIRLGELLNKTFVAYGLSARVVRYQIEGFASGASSSMQNISQENLGELWLCCPPPSEQAAIADHLKRQHQLTSSVIGRLGTQLGLLREYRQSLITAAVIGQLDIKAIEGEAG